MSADAAVQHCGDEVLEGKRKGDEHSHQIWFEEVRTSRRCSMPSSVPTLLLHGRIFLHVQANGYELGG
eukprot:893524-Pyramimonas_sp.AAC.1